MTLAALAAANPRTLPADLHDLCLSVLAEALAARPAPRRLAPGQERICVVTGYTPAWREMGELTAAAWKAYADRHGYGFVCHVADGEDPDGRPASWMRLPLLRDVLTRQGYQRALWVDADALVTNPAVRLESLIDAGQNLQLCWDQNSLNCGVMLMDGSPAMLAHLAEVDGREDLWGEFTRWVEQESFVTTLTHGRHGVKWAELPARAMNAYPGNHRPGDFVLHVGGYPYAQKLAILKRYAAGPRVRAPEAIPADFDPTQEKRRLRGGCCSPPPKD
jgi:hypothetical protein